MESDTTASKDDVVAIELPAPEGWKKKFTPKKGGTPRRNEIVFISPTGEEIKSKRQLDQYIKSHPRGPSASEFDWGTGDTPRRSARLTVKSKAEESPESEVSKKKQKKSSSKKGAGGKKDEEESAGVVMMDAEDVGDDEGKVVTEEALAEKDDIKGTKQNTNEGEGVTEDALTDTKNEMDTEQETGDKTSDDAKEEDTENKSMPLSGVEENKKKDENEKELPEPEAPSQLPVPGQAAPSVKEPEVVTDAVFETADAKVERNKEAEIAGAPPKLPEPNEAASSEQEANIFKDAFLKPTDTEDGKESEDAKTGQEGHHDKETPAEKMSSAEEAIPDNDSLKDQEVGKPMENHSHEPKASQVS